MLNIKIRVDDSETLKQLADLSVEEHVESWAEAVRLLAEDNARKKLGGDFGNRIAKSLDQTVSGLSAEVFTGREEGYIGDAVHHGGIFRARSGKMLAIPLDQSVRKGGVYAGMYPSTLKEKKIPLLYLTSKRGNKLIFQKPEKGKALSKPLFVLKETTKHRPRPWFPTEAEAAAATIQYFEENF